MREVHQKELQSFHLTYKSKMLHDFVPWHIGGLQKCFLWTWLSNWRIYMWQWHHLEPQCLLIKKELIERIFVLYKSNTGSCFCHKKYFASSLKRIEPSITDRKMFCTDKESNIVDAFTQEFPSALSIQYFRHFKKAIERKLKNQIGSDRNQVCFVLKFK